MFDFALDYVLARPVVNDSRVTVNGLSLAPEVAAPSTHESTPSSPPVLHRTERDDLVLWCRSHGAPRGGP